MKAISRRLVASKSLLQKVPTCCLMTEIESIGMILCHLSDSKSFIMIPFCTMLQLNVKSHL